MNYLVKKDNDKNIVYNGKTQCYEIRLNNICGLLISIDKEEKVSISSSSSFSLNQREWDTIIQSVSECQGLQKSVKNPSQQFNPMRTIISSEIERGGIYLTKSDEIIIWLDKAQIKEGCLFGNRFGCPYCYLKLNTVDADCIVVESQSSVRINGLKRWDVRLDSRSTKPTNLIKKIGELPSSVVEFKNEDQIYKVDFSDKIEVLEIPALEK